MHPPSRFWADWTSPQFDAARTAGTLDRLIAVLPVAGFPLESHWYLVARRDRRLSATATQLIRYLPQGLKQYLDPAWLVSDLDGLTQSFVTQNSL